MTIHKAKGLEFDTVILPGLARATSGQDRRLLYWSESVDAQGQNQLLLAPVKAHDQQTDAMVGWIQQLEKQQSADENGRVLYVATTRAKRQLHLLGSLKRDKKQAVIPPVKNSFLALLWPQLELLWPKSTLDPSDDEVSCENASHQPQVLQRLTENWQLPIPQADIMAAKTEVFHADEVEYSWASEIARMVGNVIHELLEQLGLGQRDLYSEVDYAALLTWAEQRFKQSGLNAESQVLAMRRTEAALVGLKLDSRAQWIFDSSHSEAHCEWPLTVVRAQRAKTYVLDRCFVDAQGTRWIIDYKTGSHEGGGLEVFLDEEQQRYRGQLENYAAILAELEDRPIKLGLYFPLVGGWREWDFSSQ